MILIITVLTVLCAGLSIALYHKNKLLITARCLRNSESKLGIQSSDLEQFFLNSLDMLCIADTDGCFRLLNPEWEHTLGYTMQELIGRQFLEFVHPDDKEKTLDAISQLAESKIVKGFENRYRHKDGTYKWIEWRSYPVGNMIYAAARNITDRKCAEEELMKSKMHFANIFSLSPELIAITKADDGGVMLANSMFSEVLEFDESEYLNQSTLDLGIWPFPDQRQMIIDELSLSGFVKNKEVTLKTRSGKNIICFFSAIPMVYNDNNCILSVVHDITERKQIEIELRHSEEKYRRLFENLDSGFAFHELVFNEKGEAIDFKFIDVNSKYKKIWGVDDTLIGKTVIETFPSAERKWVDIASEVISTGKPFTQINYLPLLDIYVETVEYKVDDRHFASIFNDVTIKIKADKQIRESEARFRGMVEDMPFGFALCDLIGKIIFSNHAFFNYFGFTQDEISTVDDLFDHVCPDAGVVEYMKLLFRQDVETIRISESVYSEPRVYSFESKSGIAKDVEVSVAVIEKQLFIVFNDVTEKIKIVNELISSEMKFSKIFNLSPDMIGITRLSDGVVLNGNSALNVLTGFSPDEYIGKTTKELGWWYNYQDRLDMVEELQRTGEVNNMEIMMKVKGGIILICLFSCNKIIIDNEELLLFVVHDITERKKTEKLIADERNLLRMLVDNIPDLVYVKDLDHKFTVANKTLAHILGLTVDDLIGKTDLELFPDELAIDFYGDEQILFDTGEPIINKEEFILDENGDELIIQTTKLPLRNSDGELIGLVGSGHNVTEQKRSERKIKELATLHQAILDTVSVGLLFVKNRKHIWVNSAFCKITGYGEAEMSSLSGEINYLTQEDYDRIGIEAYDLLFSGEIYSTQIQNERKDGVINWLLMSGKALNVNDPEAGVVWMVQDITEQKSAIEALRESERNYRDIFNATSDALFVHEIPSGRIVDVNDSMIRMFGFDNKEEALDSKQVELYSGSVLYKQNDLLEKMNVAIDQGVQLYEWLAKRNSGELFWTEVSLKRTSISGTQMIIASVRDIDERKKAEFELHKSEAILKSTMESMTDGLLVVTDDSRVLAYNSRFKEVFSIDQEACNSGDEKVLLSKAICQLVEPELFVQQVEAIYKTKDVTSDLVMLINGNIIERYSYPLPGDCPVVGRVWIFRDITERQKAEDILLKNQTWLRESQRIAHIGSWEYYYKKNRLVFNQEACQIYGFEDIEKALTIEEYLSYVYPADYEFVNEQLQLSISTKEFNEFECRIVRLDGNVITVLVLGAVTLSDSGELIRAFGVVQDITERRKSEAKLHEQDAKLRSIFRAAPVGICLVADRIFQECNDAMSVITGYRSDELIGKSDELLYVDKSDFIRVGYEKIRQISKSGFGSVEIRWKRKDGRVIDVLLSYSALDSSDYSKGLTLVILDITERKRAEEELRRSEERFSKSFHASPASMAITDIDTGLFIDVNQSFLNMFGYKREETIGCLSSQLNMWVENSVREKIVNQIKSVGYVNELEVQLNTKSGQVLDMLWSGVAIMLDGYQVMLSYSNDITQRKAWENEIKKMNADLESKVVERTEQLQQVNHDLEAFAYSVSHDLRAPLRHVDGFLKLMYSNIQTPSELITGYYNKIHDASKRMADMIDELLTFSRLGRKEIVFEPVAMNVLINDVIEQFKPDTEQRNIKWVIDQLPIVSADRSLLKIAFENLISNAIKYTSKRQEAVVEIGSTMLGNGRVELYIKDNGAGFDMNYVSKLFGVFQRLHASDDFEGTGIGLANVKQIIAKHNGKIRAEGKVDEGATFFVTLDIAQ